LLLHGPTGKKFNFKGSIKRIFLPSGTGPFN
jgi:hypothetical protein